MNKECDTRHRTPPRADHLAASAQYRRALSDLVSILFAVVLGVGLSKILLIEGVFDGFVLGLAFTFRKDDVLFSRLRPYLNKVRRAEEPGKCSTEFHVIRIKKGLTYAVLPEYLACVLRSSPILAQTRRMMTGNTHPRLANEDVVKLVVPIPAEPAQKRIVDEVAKRKEQVRQLRAEAASAWAAALADFEAKLLGAVS